MLHRRFHLGVMYMIRAARQLLRKLLNYCVEWIVLLVVVVHHYILLQPLEHRPWLYMEQHYLLSEYHP